MNVWAELPEEAQIAFYSDRDGNNEIYVMDAYGRNPLKLTNHPASDWYPAWRPDGQRIAFCSDRDVGYEIYVMDTDGKNPRNLTNHPAEDEVPAWSSDGQRIAFTSDRDGNCEVYAMDADGKNRRRLTNHPAQDVFADWSPWTKTKRRTGTVGTTLGSDPRVECISISLRRVILRQYAS